MSMGIPGFPFIQSAPGPDIVQQPLNPVLIANASGTPANVAQNNPASVAGTGQAGLTVAALPPNTNPSRILLSSGPRQVIISPVGLQVQAGQFGIIPAATI